MKCQNLFSGKDKRNITNMSSAELAKRMVKVKITREDSDEPVPYAQDFQK